MFEDIELIYTNIKILVFWGWLYNRNWRRYMCLAMTSILLLTQFIYMFRTKEGIVGIIRNSYILVLWINTVLRAILLMTYRKRYEVLINDLVTYYIELKSHEDDYIQHLLRDVNRAGQIMARGNMVLGMLTSIGFYSYPLVTTERVLPFGSIIPGIDEYRTPYYQIMYIYQVVITPMGCCMYIPFTSLIVSFIMFATVMCKSLQRRLQQLNELSLTTDSIRDYIIACIMYQQRIINFILSVNELTTYIFLFEFIAFGALLCALLFMLLIVDSMLQMIIVCAYIIMILAQIFALYWYANELREQNMEIAIAAYETDWYTFEVPVQKCILLLILRSQQPSTIKVGNIRPMTLELFQALLNASYSYFTVLKRVYG